MLHKTVSQLAAVNLAKTQTDALRAQFKFQQHQLISQLTSLDVTDIATAARIQQEMRDLQQSYAAQCYAIQQQQATSTSAARHKRGNVKAVVAKPRTLSDYLASISSQAPQGSISSTSSQAMPAGADVTSAHYEDTNASEDGENEYESFMAEESASRLRVQALLDQAAL